MSLQFSYQEAKLTWPKLELYHFTSYLFHNFPFHFGQCEKNFDYEVSEIKIMVALEVNVREIGLNESVLALADWYVICFVDHLTKMGGSLPYLQSAC